MRRESVGGWNLESEPDGTVRLTRDSWFVERLFGAALPLFFAVIAFLFLPQVLVGLETAGKDDELSLWMMLAFILYVGIAFGGWAAWTMFGEEQWRVRVNFLEVRRGLCGFTRTRRYTDGRLVVRQAHEVGGEGRSHVKTRLRVETPGRSGTLGEGSLERLESLGRFVAAHTGWPLHVRRIPD